MADKTGSDVAKQEINPAVLLALEQVINGTKKGHHKIETVTEFSTEVNKIIIPAGMTKKAAADDLMLQWTNEEQKQDFLAQFDGWEWKDTLRAFRNVLEERFGWIKGVKEESWFGTTYPMEIDIVTNIKDGVKTSEKAFYGKVSFPSMDGAQGEVGIQQNGVVYVKINAKKKYSTQITEFFNEIRNYLQHQSIYRGKAVVVSMKGVQDNHIIDLEITEIKPNPRIFLNAKEEVTVEQFVIGDIGEHGKRCYLFTGTYGNGKTETAMRVGAAGIKKGVSFFYVKDSSLLVETLGFAKNYEPCIIFLEDVDETTSGEDRDERMNQILNTLDGVQTKGRDIMVLFTTNHEKRINKALRRPGRIDLIVNFSNPDNNTKTKIYKSFFDKLSGSENIDYELVVAESPNAQGAVIAEIAQRAVKLAKKNGFIDTDGVRAAQASMEYQIAFMAEDSEAPDKLKTAMETFKEYFVGDIFEVVDRIDDRV